MDSGVIKNVVQAAGVELARVLDEPMAANAILKIKNGAVVDVGGGTKCTFVSCAFSKKCNFIDGGFSLRNRKISIVILPVFVYYK